MNICTKLLFSQLLLSASNIPQQTRSLITISIPHCRVAAFSFCNHELFDFLEPFQDSLKGWTTIYTCEKKIHKKDKWWIGGALKCCWLCSDVSMCRCVEVLMCRCWRVNVLMRWYVDVLMSRCVEVLMCLCVDVLMCWCVDVLMTDYWWLMMTTDADWWWWLILMMTIEGWWWRWLRWLMVTDDDWW
jgi:alkylhydroperoxidase/carboxymuconolactone decarboxylase family protein YurZ